MHTTLTLPLQRKWFEMTKEGIKTEDYREITPYWCKRLIELDEEMEYHIWIELIEDLSNINRKHKDVYECLSFYGAKIKKFIHTKLTLGYPSNDDTSRIITFENKGIEIGIGNPEWGAPNHPVFIIKHGGQVK